MVLITRNISQAFGEEEQVDFMSEKKLTGRRSLVVLSILCIVLLVGLTAAMISYARLDSAYNDKTSEFDTYAANHSHNNTEYDAFSHANWLLEAYKMTHTHLDYYYTWLIDTLNLERNAIWTLNQIISQPADSYTSWYNVGFNASYAGYISVDVQSSTTNNTYVQVIWSSYLASFDQKIVVGTNGTANFPILPTSNIDIRIGNSNIFDGATENVTATYYY
jgi:hypothetical protein